LAQAVLTRVSDKGRPARFTKTKPVRLRGNASRAYRTWKLRGKVRTSPSLV
jgi:hypothetical protein